MSSSYKGPRATARAGRTTTTSQANTGSGSSGSDRNGGIGIGRNIGNNKNGGNGRNGGNDKNGGNGRNGSSSSSDNKTATNGSGQPDLSKYAKYLQDDGGVKFDEAQYKPSIRAERHQMNYTAARRNRGTGNDGADSGVGNSNEEPGQRRRPAHRPHIRSYSLNRTAASSDVGGSRLPSFQTSSGASTNANTQGQGRPGENLFTKSRISKADVLEEETSERQSRTGLSGAQARTGLAGEQRTGFSGEQARSGLAGEQKTGFSGSSYTGRTGFSSSSSGTDDQESSGPVPRRAAGTRASRAGRPASSYDTYGNYDSAESFLYGSKSAASENTFKRDETRDAAENTKSTQEPRKKYFTPVSEYFNGAKASGENSDRTSSTPKASSKFSNVRDSELPRDGEEPRKTFLTPEWNSKYFPPPYESFGDNRSQDQGRFSSSSCRESPIKDDNRESENNPKYSPKRSSRSSLFDNLGSQDSRRSHSLDGRNRTPNKDDHAHSPSPQSAGGPRRRSRIDQMNSLNESNFESKTAFKEHLLNLTMNKDEYEGIMSDFKNGSFVEDPKVGDEEPEPVPEIVPEIVISDAGDSSDGSKGSLHESTPVADDVSKDPAKDKDETSAKESANQSDKEEAASDTTDSKSGSDSKEKSVSGSEKELNKDSDDNGKSEKESKEKENYFRMLEQLIQAAREKYSNPDLQKCNESQVTLEPILADGLTHKWRFQKTEFGVPTSMGITSDGCVVVADYGNSCLEFFNVSGDFEHKIEGVKPFGILINKKDNVIVGDRRGKAIRIFDKFGADVAQWESKTFGWISGIASLQNGRLVICDRDRCKVGIYSEGGEIITEFGSYGSSNSQICMADFVAVDSKDRIIIADSGNHCLKLFDTNGKAIGKISTRGTDDGKVEWPKGVCVVGNDNIVVADMHNNRVSMFSPNGDFIQHLLSATPNPYNVCYGVEAGMLGTLHYSLKGFSQYDVYSL